MKKIFCDKRTPIITQAAFALLVVLSMFFCFSYYTWSTDVYKTFGFESLGIFITDYGVFEISLLLSLIFSAIIIVVNLLKLLNVKPFGHRAFIFVACGVSTAILICGILAFVYTHGYVAIDTIDGGGTSEVFRGAGSYMHLIFSALTFVVSALELFRTLKNPNKERGMNERL